MSKSKSRNKTKGYNNTSVELTYISNFSYEQIENFRRYFTKFKKETINLNNENDEEIPENELLSREEFRASLGVLDTKSCNYISNRLFDVISTTENKKYITFKDYILFLDLVNYGTKENKLKHCFRYFDINNKGYITNKDFTDIMFNLCLFFSSLTMNQVTTNKTELSLLYDHYISKAGIKTLDFDNFKMLLDKFPNFLDFYDIFNNNINTEISITLKREQLDELINIKNSIFDLKQKLISSQNKYSSVTLATEEYIDQVYDLKKDFCNISSIKNDLSKNNNIKISCIPDNSSEQSSEFLSKNNNNYNVFLKNTYNNNINFNVSLKNTYNNMNKKNKTIFSKANTTNNTNTIKSFPLSQNDVFLNKFQNFMKNNQKISPKDVSYTTTSVDFSDSSNEDSKSSSSKSNSKSSSHSKNSKNTNNIKVQNKNSTGKKSSIFNSIYKRDSLLNVLDNNLNNYQNKFKFLQPFIDIKDNVLKDQLKKNGYDLNNILIITNKLEFQSFIDEILNSFGVLLNNLLPNEKKMYKREGIVLGENIEFDLGKIRSVKVLQDNEIQKNIMHFGNPNLQLTVNIMIGIKNSVSKIGKTMFNSNNSILANKNNNLSFLFPADNALIFKETTRYIYGQNNFGDEPIICRFYDFAPKIFYNIRYLYGVSNDNYLKSLGPENFLGNLIITKNKSLQEICSSGKSGSFFYYSYDSKYLMKTISENEFIKFREILKDYYTYILNHPKTLMQRLFGLYTFIFNSTKMFFVVMNNVFDTPLQVNYKYDLKGSTYQRTSRNKNDFNYLEYDFDKAMKDNDFIERKEKINISEYEKINLYNEAKNDSKFLADHNINDYSFLIGVYDQNFYDKRSKSKDTHRMKALPQEDIYKLTVKKSTSFITNTQSLKIRKPFYQNYLGGIKSEDGNKVYFFGIIDILTNYGGKKKMEHLVKSISQGSGISCKPPDEYSDRFINFIKRILDVDNVKSDRGNEIGNVNVFKKMKETDEKDRCDEEIDEQYESDEEDKDIEHNCNNMSDE